MADGNPLTQRQATLHFKNPAKASLTTLDWDPPREILGEPKEPRGPGGVPELFSQHLSPPHLQGYTVLC